MLRPHGEEKERRWHSTRAALGGRLRGERCACSLLSKSKENSTRSKGQLLEEDRPRCPAEFWAVAYSVGKESLRA